MLRIVIGATENYDESQSEFVKDGGTVIDLEHSLLSLSKWESEYEQAFLGTTKKTGEEVIGYVRCMCLTPDIPPELFNQLSKENLEAVNAYIDAKMTATWFSEDPGAPKTREVITNELIYYWMTTFQIPFECEKWHLNRLFTLIRICNIKQSKPKKMSRAEMAARNRELNAKRKERFNTTG
jgi:hypothetical protein